LEIRYWPPQYLVLPSDMNNSTNDMYQHSHDVLNLTPIILWGLQQSGLSGNTVSFSIGAARVADITTTTYPYLPTPTYGTGYPAYIQIIAGSNSVTLNTATTPCYIVATYSISPTTSGQNLYTITGNLAQIATASYNPAIHARLALATYSAGVWTIDQTPGTHRELDSAGFGGTQWNLQTSQLVLGPPPGYTGSTITTQSGQNVVLTNNLTVNGNTQFQGTVTNLAGYSYTPGRTDVATTGTAINSLTSATNEIRFTGSTPTTVNGITAGIAGQGLTLYNESSAVITFTNQSGSATGSKLLNPIAQSYLLNPGFCIKYIYDDLQTFWVLSATSSAKLIAGTTDGLSVPAGFLGEQIISTIAQGSAVSAPATTLYGDITSISLTAGVWNIDASGCSHLNGATLTVVGFGVSATSGNSSTGLTIGSNFFNFLPSTSTTDTSCSLAGYRVSLSATTTYYLKMNATYSAGTPQFYGTIRATRVG
jgi:hypothetical protein